MSESFPIAGGFHPDDEPATEAEANISAKEFLADFAEGNPTLDDGVSIRHRPDAISLSYLTCFTLGPIQIGDFSAGPVDRPWKVRVSGSVIYSSRLNAARTDYDPEVELFRFTGVAPTEIDAAFDQAARILVCMERPSGVGNQSEVWIYFYDVFTSSYVLTNFGAGRTPRAVLDDAVDSNNADIIVFYVNNTVGMCYRVQRERYVTEHIIDATLYIAPPPVGTPIVNTCTHGPVVFDYTIDPKVLSGSLDGIIVEVRAPLDTLFGIVQTYFTPFRAWAHSDQPGIFRPMNNFNDRYSFTGNIPDPDGWRIQSAPIAVDFGLSQLVTGYNRNIQSTDVVLSFTPVVEGVEIEGISTLDYNNRIVAYDALGNVLGSIEPTPPYAFARRTGPYAIYAPGIKTVKLVPAIGQVYNNGISWSRLRFKKTGDAPAIPILVEAPPFIPADAIPLNLPIPPIENIYLEDVYRSTSNRLDVLYSVHDPVTGTYRLAVKSSVLYPFKVDVENWKMGAIPLSGGVPNVLLFVMLPGQLNPSGGAPDGFTANEPWKFAASLLSTGTLVSIILFHTLYDKDEWKMQAVLLSGIIQTVLFFHTLYDKDEWKMNAVLLNGTVPVVLFLHTLYDKDEWKMNALLQSGTLV